MRKRAAVCVVVATVVVLVAASAGCKKESAAPAPAGGPTAAGSASGSGRGDRTGTGSGDGSGSGSGTGSGDGSGTGSGSGSDTSSGSAADATTDAKAPDFVGNWRLDHVRTSDGPVPKEKLAKGGMTWELKADHTLEMKVWTGDQSVTANATWTLDGKVVTIDEHGQLNKVKITRKGDKLTIAATTSSVVMTFVQVKPEPR